MQINDKSLRSIVLQILSIVVIAIFAASAAPVYAQQNNSDQAEQQTEETEQEQDEVADLDRVVVTGSRVSRSEFSSISPVQVIDGEISRDLGLVDAADLIRQASVVQGQQITTGLSTSAGLLTDSGPGSATASLRGLDAGRTLVLINGRRLAPAGVGGAPSAPDLNLIPGSLIDRADILLDGASSVYGSDAVAGVINFILRNDFDGLQLDAFYSDPQTVDGGRQRVMSATWGMNSDRGFIGFALEHSREFGYNERAFADFYEPYDNGCLSRYHQGASGQVYESCGGSFGAGAASTSAFGFLGFEEGRNVDGLPPGFFPISLTDDLLDPNSENGRALLIFPEELDAAFAPEFERTTFFTYGEYAPGWYGDATTYFEASWASRQTSTNTAGQGRIRLPGDYVLGNFGGLPATLYYQSRFLQDTEVAQSRMTGGIRGDLPFLDIGSLAGWGYDAYVSYSRSNGDDAISGIPFFPRLEQTLSNTRIDPETGEAVCDPRIVPGEGQPIICRPLNFFDPTFIATGRFPDEADNAYLFPNRITNTIVEQTVYNGFVSGGLFDLPWGGPVSLVLGFEYRVDAIETRTDAGASAGDFLGFAGDPGATGERWLREVFTELEVPLISDRPFVHDLSFNVAARWTEEENFGEETTFRVQGQYAPVSWLRARSTFGTSFRAPNLGEQFGGQVTGFATNFSDPCRVPEVAIPFVDDDNDPNTPDVRLYDSSLDTRDPVLIQNCVNGGGPFGLEPTNPTALGVRGLGTQNPVFLGSSTQSASGSNPDLDAETSEAFTAGLVFEQPWSDAFDLRLSATYFDITIEDEVDSLSANTIVNRCYNSPGLTDPTCQFITRDPRDDADSTTGEVSFVLALDQNLGTQQVEGIDYNIEFGTDFPLLNLDNRVDYDLVIRATQVLTDTEEEFTIDDIIIDDDLREFGNPEWRVNLTNVLGYGDWRFLWQSRYISSMIEDNDPDEQNEETTSSFNPCVQADDGPCLQFDGLSSYWVHDASVAWQGESMVIRFGVNNVFDDAPPLTDNNELSNLAGIGYDIGGRTLFGNITISF